MIPLAKFVAALSVYGILSFIAAGVILAAFPGAGLAVVIGWLVAAYIASRGIKDRYLGPENSVG